jgi:hypothetical protein
LRRLEGHRGFPTALRAHGHGFRFGESRTGGALALHFAVLAPFGLVLEVLVVEEVLFSRCKYEICSAINALENAILKLRHSNCAPFINLNWNRTWLSGGSGDWQYAGPAAAVLLDFPATLFPVSFAGKRLLSPELLARLQIEGMSLHFLDDVLLLDLTLETAKGVL